jgi:L-arabinose isomerase
VDIDGHFTYSIIINIKMNTQLSVQIIGNPVHQNLHLEISGTDGKAISFSIIDASGKRYKTIMAGDGSKQINIEDLSSGMYYLMYQSGNNSFSMPFTKQ